MKKTHKSLMLILIMSLTLIMFNNINVKASSHESRAVICCDNGGRTKSEIYYQYRYTKTKCTFHPRCTIKYFYNLKITRCASCNSELKRIEFIDPYQLHETQII